MAWINGYEKNDEKKKEHRRHMDFNSSDEEDAVPEIVKSEQNDEADPPAELTESAQPAEPPQPAELAEPAEPAESAVCTDSNFLLSPEELFTLDTDVKNYKDKLIIQKRNIAKLRLKATKIIQEKNSFMNQMVAMAENVIIKREELKRVHAKIYEEERRVARKLF